MAKIAIPSYGGNRTGHLLTRGTLMACVASSCIAIAGCDSEAMNSSPATQANAETGLLELVHDNALWQTSKITWPRDLYEHPEAPIESREWFVLLVDGQDGAVHSVVQRLSRAALARPVAATVTASADSVRQSAWRFDNGMQIAGQWIIEGGASRDWSETERAAAGLASVPGSSDQHTTGANLSAHVLGHAVSFSGSDTASPRSCSGTWQLQLADGSTVTVEQYECPAGSATRSTASSRSGPLRASGITRIDGQKRHLSGVAWTRHVWGRASAPSDAVRFNTLFITLAGLGTYEIVSTQRTSGRGRAVVTARQMDADQSTTHESVEWQSSSPTEPSLSDRSRLHIPSLNVDVEIRPLRDSHAVDPDGRIRHTVTVAGSHQGAGYLDVAGEAP